MLLRMPLHYQILIALVLGTSIGVFFNPKAVKLESIEGFVRIVDGHVVLEERTDEGDLFFREEFTSQADFEKRYPHLSQKQGTDLKFAFKITERELHFVEQPKVIAVEYTRTYVEKVVASKKFASQKEIATQFPSWKEPYEEYVSKRGGASRWISIWSKWGGDFFLRLLKMITIPLIVTSLITGVAGLGDTSRLGKMFGKTMLYYFVTSMLAICTGLIMVNILQPGMSVKLPGGGDSVVAGKEESLKGVFGGLINNMVPTNPIHALAEGQFLSIITFSILVGIFIIYSGGKTAEYFRNFFQHAFEVMMNMTMFIIKLAPLGVLAFMTFATVSQGFGIFGTLAKYMMAVFFALVIHSCIVLPLLVKFVGKRSPFKFASAMSPALMTAFSTASSNATLPLTISCVEERAKISNRVSSFVLPLGATINMDGSALYEAVAVMFIAQAYGRPLTLEVQLMIALTALLASVGAAGIPHAGLVMMAIVLQTVGLPLEAQGIILAVDRVLDMCRTSVNVWSDSCGCAIISRFEGQPDLADP